MKKIFFLILLIFPMVSVAMAKLTVILDWYPNPNHAPLIIAKEKGYFNNHGLAVELIGPSDPTDPPKWVAAKKADIGITYQPAFLEQVDRGLPLIHIGTLIDKPLNCLIALKEGPIKNIHDLKGKKVGVVSDGLSSIMLKNMLSKEGLQAGDITLINVRYNLTQALLSHQIAAATGMMRNVEVPMLELNGHETIVFFPEEYGIPTYSELIFITHLDLSHDKRFTPFIDAIREANAYLDAHPKESWALFIKTYPESNNTVNRTTWFTTLPYFADNPTELDTVEWQQFADFMLKNHLINKIQPITRYTTLQTH